MKKLLFSFVLICAFFSQASFAADLKPVILDPQYNHTKYAPKCSSDDILRQFRAYTTCFDGDDDDNGDGIPDKWAIPQWVSYEIKKYPGKLPKAPKRPAWITDKELFEKRIVPADDSYKFSNAYRETNPDSTQLGYDRGHMCMKQHAWRIGADADWNTHTLLNICPQKHQLNTGIWLDMENKTADWADEYGSVWIITGPVVFNSKPTKWLGEPGEVPVVIPDAFFKVVIHEAGPELHVLAFIYPQAGVEFNCNNCNHTPYLTSVDIIEALTGLDFFPELPGEIQDKIEGVVHVKVWE